jgi:hypothetical protein
MENATKMEPAPFGAPIYDQIALAEQVGAVNSVRIMTIMRNLRKHSPIKEGELAAKACERMFLPEWSQFVNWLLEWGWIKTEPTGHGLSRRIHLTDKGEQFMAARLDPQPAPVEE